jgi:hypothetical protein
MTPSTLYILCALLICGASATTTNTTLRTSSPYIITYTPTAYTTSNGDEGILMITDYFYTNMTSNIPDVSGYVSIEDMLYNIMYQICELIIFILSYKYIITNICFIYNSYNRVKTWLDIEPEPEPEPELPSIKIYETIIDDEDDDYQNCSIYKTSKYEMTIYNKDIKIDDIVYNGECYINTNDNYLYSNNFKPIKLKNPTYRQLLIIATLSPFTEKDKTINVDDIDINNDMKLDNIQIITIKYSP